MADRMLWCHIFCHRFLHYPFEIKSEYDWMSRYFFTGGLMPTHNPTLKFVDHHVIEHDHYISVVPTLQLHPNLFDHGEKKHALYFKRFPRTA